MSLADAAQDVCALVEEHGSDLALARYGFNPGEAKLYAVEMEEAGVWTSVASAFLHGCLVGGAHSRNLSHEKEAG